MRNFRSSRTRSSRTMVQLVMLAAVLAGFASTASMAQSAESAKPAANAGSARQIAEKYLRDYDAAVQAKDAKAFADLLDDQISEQVSVSLPNGQSQNVTADKAMMVQSFAQATSMMTDHKIERKDIQVTRQDDGSLLVKNSVNETMTIQGNRLATQTQETITLAVDGDSVKAKKVVATSSLQPLGGQ